MNIDHSLMPRQRSNLHEQPIGDECMLFDDTDQCVHVLNGTAWEVWKHCDGSFSVSQIAQVLAQQYAGVDYEKILVDVSKIVAEFQQLNLVQGQES